MRTQTQEETRFEQWMQQVRTVTAVRFGVSVDDLPDMNFRDSFDEGVTPTEFVANDVTMLLADEFGYDDFDDEDDGDFDEEYFDD